MNSKVTLIAWAKTEQFLNVFHLTQPGPVQPLRCSASRFRRSLGSPEISPLRPGWTWQLSRTRSPSKSGESLFWEEPVSGPIVWIFFSSIFSVQKSSCWTEQVVSVAEPSVRSGQSVTDSSAPLYSGLEGSRQGFVAHVAPSGFSIHFSLVYMFTCWLWI